MAFEKKCEMGIYDENQKFNMTVEYIRSYSDQYGNKTTHTIFGKKEQATKKELVKYMQHVINGVILSDGVHNAHIHIE